MRVTDTAAEVAAPGGMGLAEEVGEGEGEAGEEVGGVEGVRFAVDTGCGVGEVDGDGASGVVDDPDLLRAVGEPPADFVEHIAGTVVGGVNLDGDVGGDGDELGGGGVVGVLGAEVGDVGGADRVGVAVEEEADGVDDFAPVILLCMIAEAASDTGRQLAVACFGLRHVVDFSVDQFSPIAVTIGQTGELLGGHHRGHRIGGYSDTHVEIIRSGTREIPHARQAVEVHILCPELGVMGLSGGVDDAVGEGEAVADADTC